jgi:hypothetical protein
LWLTGLRSLSRHLRGRNGHIETEYDAADVKKCMTCFIICVSRIAALESDSVPS